MDIKYLKIKIVQGHRTIELDNTKYKIIAIDGIDYPELDISTNPNAHYDGCVVDSNRVDKRIITINADYCGNNKEIERKNLISFFNPKLDFNIIIDYCENKKAAQCRINDFKAEINNIHDILNFEIELLCVDPYLHDVDEVKQEVALWRPAFHFPLIIPKDKGIIMGYREPSLIANLINTGDVPIGIKVDFIATGTVINPSIFNVNTREFIKINTTMQAGDKITVNTRTGEKQIILNRNGVETNILNLLDLDSTFLHAEKGDNLYRYDADNGLNALQISIYFNPSYLGV